MNADIKGTTIVNGLTLDEHKELGRAMATVMGALDILEFNATGGDKRLYASASRDIDAMLEWLSDRFLASYQSDCDPRENGDYPYPLFSIDGRVLMPAEALEV